MTKEEIIKPENLVYKKPTLMNDNAMHYCPGCSHGVVHKLIAEVIEETGHGAVLLSVFCFIFLYNHYIIKGEKTILQTISIKLAVQNLFCRKKELTADHSGAMMWRRIGYE